MLKLTRELRFGLSDFDAPLAKDASNGFAANPPLLGLDPFLILSATISGQLDPATGMLVNIKTIDHLLRIYAVPFLREKYEARRSPKKDTGPSEFTGRPLGRILIKLGILKREQIHLALAKQADQKKSTGTTRPIGEILIDLGLITFEQRNQALELQRSHAGSTPAHSQPAQFLPELFSIITQKLFPHSVESIHLKLSPFLSFAVHKEKHDMVQLSLRFEFSAAHRLYSSTLSEKENWDTFGRCTNPNGHGHNYELEVTLAGTPNPATGEILPIPILQQIVNEKIIHDFDHKHLNLDCPEFKDGAGGGVNPTVENIAKVIFQKLKPNIPAPAALAHIRIWETPKTAAEYSE